MYEPSDSPPSDLRKRMQYINDSTINDDKIKNRSKNIVSTTVIPKKIYIASVLTAAFLISAGYAECKSALPVSFISIANLLRISFCWRVLDQP